MASPSEECRSPVGLDCCSCCLDLANRSGLEEGALGFNNNLGSPGASPFQQLREQLVCENLNADKLSRIMRQDSLEPVVRDPCYLLNQGICNRNIDQTLLSILLFFHRWVGRPGVEGARPLLRIRPSRARPWHCPAQSRAAARVKLSPQAEGKIGLSFEPRVGGCESQSYTAIEGGRLGFFLAL